MICPLKPQGDDPYEEGYLDAECDDLACAWWDDNKQQCCIKTLSELKVSGLVSTHPS